MSRSLLIFAFCIPLAILMGFMLSDPFVSKNMMVIGILGGLLLLPVAITFHHSALIWTSTMFMTAFFVKGQPPMWMLMALVSLAVAIISRPLSAVKPKPVWTRGMVASLAFLVIVMLITAKFRGGIGIRSFGGDVYGGRRYVFIIFAIIGFFALTMQTIPKKRIASDLRMFALGPATAALSNIAYMLGPAFYFLFLLFPVDMALGQAAADLSPGFEGIKRVSGFGPASIGITGFCLMRWGFTGVLSLHKPWRALIMLCALGLGVISGFRSHISFCILLMTIQFFAEGLHRTRYLAGFICGLTVVFSFIAVFSEKLPIPAQRALSFLPIRVDAHAKIDARNSNEWRLEMWEVLAKDIPKYFWLGKGYAIDPTDLFLANESIARGFADPNEFFIKAGDYHSGPFSLILPFGVWGVIAFAWILYCGIKILWNNMKYGDADLKKINVFLYSIFMARLVFFVVIFGAFEQDLWIFLATIGLSLCINGGVRGVAQKPSLKFEPKAIRKRQEELVAAV